jgi:hypothetical protein
VVKARIKPFTFQSIVPLLCLTSKKGCEKSLQPYFSSTRFDVSKSRGTIHGNVIIILLSSICYHAFDYFLTHSVLVFSAIFLFRKDNFLSGVPDGERANFVQPTSASQKICGPDNKIQQKFPVS